MSFLTKVQGRPWYSNLTLSWGQMALLAIVSAAVMFLQFVIYTSVEGNDPIWSGQCTVGWVGADKSTYPTYVDATCNDVTIHLPNSVAIDYYRYNRMIPVQCSADKGKFTKATNWTCSVPYHSKGK